MAAFDSTFKVSPDGQSIASQKTFYERGALDLIDFSTGKVFTLTDQIGDLMEAFAWSPDGKTLAYSLRPLDTRIPEIWIVNADGSSPQQLLKGEWGTSYQHLALLPDGQTLLFDLDAGGNSYDDGWSLMAMNIMDGSVKRLLMNGSGIRLFDEGRKILFSRNSTDIGIWIAELSC